MIRHLEERKTGEKKGTCLTLIRVLGKLIVVRVSFLGYFLAKNNLLEERGVVSSRVNRYYIGLNDQGANQCSNGYSWTSN